MKPPQPTAFLVRFVKARARINNIEVELKSIARVLFSIVISKKI